ncbi:Predicted arabinose efflux permease, MFS family [Sphingobium faniae]|nr:Predicted arabinose efflux permease, MFS family [Sphingobium faniae]
MTTNTQLSEKQTFSWFVFGLMASVTFVGILSELVPSGILPQMSDGLGVSESRVGFLVGVYALASAICAIPLVSATLAVNRKKLLMALLIGFAASNIVVAISSSYEVIVASRILGGICAGVMWPMIAAYGTRLVPDNMHGKAITVIMSGNTLGIAIGLPVMTTIGLTFGWRTAFMALGLIVVAIAVLSWFFLPSVEGEKLTKSNSPLAVLKMPSILIILLLTFLSVAAHYGAYTYITLIVQLINFAGGIAMAMLIFGIGSVISVFGSAKYIDAYLRPLIVSMLIVGAIAMALLLTFRGTPGISHLAFFLWGLAFGPLVTMYQTAVSKQVSEAKGVATSVQSSVFNFSIMIATGVGGALLTEFPGRMGARGIVYLSLICFVSAAIIAFFAKRTLRSS